MFQDGRQNNTESYIAVIHCLMYLGIFVGVLCWFLFYYAPFCVLSIFDNTLTRKRIININIFKIIDTRISFYSRNTHLLPPKPKSSFRHLKRGIQDFHKNYVLVPADKAANNVVVV